MSWKKSLLLICKILGLFVNTMTADDKYSILDRNNLTQPIHMQLSKNRKAFCQFLTACWKCRSNFKHFFKKEDLHSLSISEVTFWEMSKTSHFRRPFENPGKPSHTLLKSAPQLLYNVYWWLWRKLKSKKPLLPICKIFGLFEYRWRVFCS